MILRGNDFWNAYNGMLDGNLTGARYDVLSDLIETSSARFQNEIKNIGIKYSEEKLEDIISSYEAEIPGISGMNVNHYFKKEVKNLDVVGKKVKEGNNAILLEIEARRPKGFRKFA